MPSLKFFPHQPDPSQFLEIPDNTAAFHYDFCAVFEKALFSVIEEEGKFTFSPFCPFFFSHFRPLLQVILTMAR